MRIRRPKSDVRGAHVLPPADHLPDEPLERTPAGRRRSPPSSARASTRRGTISPMLSAGVSRAWNTNGCSARSRPRTGRTAWKRSARNRSNDASASAWCVGQANVSGRRGCRGSARSPRRSRLDRRVPVGPGSRARVAAGELLAVLRVEATTGRRRAGRPPPGRRGAAAARRRSAASARRARPRSSRRPAAGWSGSSGSRARPRAQLVAGVGDAAVRSRASQSSTTS